MSIRSNGSYIGPRPAGPNTSVASGIWDLRSAGRQKRAEAWPLPLIDPASISGLQAWYDASDSNTLYDATTGGSLVAADGGVARWEDKSGNAVHLTQSTSANRPARKASTQNSLDTVLFDGNNDGLSLGAVSLSSSDWTFFLACNPTSDTAGARYFFDTGSGRLILAMVGNGTGNTGFFDGTWRTVSDATTGAQVLTWNLNSSGTSAKVYRNGAQIGSTVAYTQKAIGGGAFFGCSYDGAGAFADFSAFEFLIYDSALSDTNREAVETYLLTKWGIS